MRRSCFRATTLFLLFGGGSRALVVGTTKAAAGAAAARRTLVRRKNSPGSQQEAYIPSVPVAINGGDPWAGWRVTDSELNELCEAAMSSPRRPVMKQFHPRRGWLWRQWHGTIVRSVLQNEVKLSVAWALAVSLCATTGFKPIENFFPIGQTLVAFVLSFFLSQTYAVWRNVYSIARRVQGRLSDLGLILATFAERDFYSDDQNNKNNFSPRAQATLDTWARYARLFTMLYFASVTTRFAPLATPMGLRALEQHGAITADEANQLIETSSWHQTVVAWMGTLVSQGLHQGAITGGSSVQYHVSVTIANLRASYAQMSDELSGRMPLAYTHLVQLTVDLLCLAAPLALIGPLGPVGAVLGTAFVTLFYAGVLSLAKILLDPFDNEDYGGRSGIRLEADTLIQEVNVMTRRWSTCAAHLPDAVLSPRLSERSVAKMMLPGPTSDDDDDDDVVTQEDDDDDDDDVLSHVTSFLDEEEDVDDGGASSSNSTTRVESSLGSSSGEDKPLITRKIVRKSPVSLKILKSSGRYLRTRTPHSSPSSPKAKNAASSNSTAAAENGEEEEFEEDDFQVLLEGTTTTGARRRSSST